MVYQNCYNPSYTGRGLYKVGNVKRNLTSEYVYYYEKKKEIGFILSDFEFARSRDM